MTEIVLFQAKKIVAMGRNWPEAPRSATGGPVCPGGRGEPRRDDDAPTVPPQALKDIPVAGTVPGGQPKGER